MLEVNTLKCEDHGFFILGSFYRLISQINYPYLKYDVVINYYVCFLVRNAFR